MTAASGRPGATGSPLHPKTLFPSSLVSRVLRMAALSPVSLPSLRPRMRHGTLPPISLAPLEARQMSGIRLRHLSVSPSVTFDSRQIERRARWKREEGRNEGRLFTRSPVTRRQRSRDGHPDEDSKKNRLYSQLCASCYFCLLRND